MGLREVPFEEDVPPENCQVRLVHQALELEQAAPAAEADDREVKTRKDTHPFQRREGCSLIRAVECGRATIHPPAV